MLNRIDSSLLEGVVALGVSKAIPYATPELALRRSFPDHKKKLISSYASTILAVTIKNTPKEVRYVLVEAIAAVAALKWGMVRVTMTYSLTAIEHHIGCSGSHIKTIDVSEICTTDFDPENKPVLVVQRSHLIT